MTRGKHSVRSALQRAEAAHQVIDRLTTELTEAKLRARQVEARARMVPELQARIRELESDPVVAEIAKWASDVKRANTKQRREWLDGARHDLMGMFKDLLDSAPPLTDVERVEFLARRYPFLMGFLWGARGGASIDGMASPDYRAHELRTQRFSPEARKRLERAVGLRHTITWSPEWDAADIACDLLDAHRLHMTKEEMREYFSGRPPLRRGVNA